MATHATSEERPLTGLRYRPSVMSVVGLVLVGLLLFWLGVNLVKTPSDFLEITLIGVTVGAVYALVALGYTLVYGILELINFAHGDVFMLGAMMSRDVHDLRLRARRRRGGEQVAAASVLVTLVVAMAFCGTLNATIELVAYRPLRGAPRLAPLITAIGMSFILQNIGLAWKGPNYVSDPEHPADRRRLQRSAARTTVGQADRHPGRRSPCSSLLVWLVQQTRQGKAMRATAQDQDAAAMMGINVNRTISFTFVIAGGLAGAAGLLYALYFTNVRCDQGFQLGLIAFTAAVLGGIGNLPGAVLGALIIGLIQAFNEGLGWHSPGSDWTQSIVFSILILILVFRPEGLLGERTPEGG